MLCFQPTFGSNHLCWVIRLPRSDQKPGAVAAALERIAGLQRAYRQRIAEAEAPADKDPIVAEAPGEFSMAVTDQGLSLEEYLDFGYGARRP